MKFLLGAYMMTILNSLLLQVSDSFWSNLPVLITSVVGAILSLLAFIRAGQASKTSSANALKIDGLLIEKTKADKAIGAKEERDTRDRADASENVGKLKEMQKNKDTVTEVKEIKEVIVKTVEAKADETKEVVKEIPDEVVKKLPPQ